MKYNKVVRISFFSVLFVLFILAFVRVDKINNDYTCIDGDTFKFENDYYRLAYVDTPEKNSHGYYKASNSTCEFLMLNKEIKLEEKGFDKYGRTLVIVYNQDGTNLNERLIEKCLAEPFYGKTTEYILNTYKHNCN